jgi:cell division protein FtsB
MIFFDKQNYFYRTKLDKEMEGLVKDTVFYEKEIRESSRQLDELNGDKKALEKLGREKYLMKKDDEDVFIIVNEAEKAKN